MYCDGNYIFARNWKKDFCYDSKVLYFLVKRKSILNAKTSLFLNKANCYHNSTIYCYELKQEKIKTHNSDFHKKHQKLNQISR